MKSDSQNSRPKNLDKRVFFCKDFPGTKILHKNDALYLHIEYHNQYKQFGSIGVSGRQNRINGSKPLGVSIFRFVDLQG